MSNDTPKEKQKADSFVGRFSKVVMCLASIGAGYACLALTMPGLDLTGRDFYDTLLVVSCFVWPVYLTIIYLCGRFEDASANTLGKGVSFLELSSIPLGVGLGVALVSWLMWRLPNGIIWVSELFRG
jgi:hypothetical protein